MHLFLKRKTVDLLGERGAAWVGFCNFEGPPNTALDRFGKDPFWYRDFV